MQHPRQHDVVRKTRLPGDFRAPVDSAARLADDIEVLALGHWCAPTLAAGARRCPRGGAVRALGRPGGAHVDSRTAAAARALCAGFAHPPRRFLDRFVDLHVPRAAAQIARNRLLDPLAAGVRILVEQRLRRHQDARRAIAALRAAQVGERGLQRVQRRPAGEAFDRLDGLALAFDRQHEAGEQRLSVHQHGARAALAQFAAVLGAGQVEVLAQHLEQRLVRREQQFRVLAVDAQCHPHVALHADLRLLRVCHLGLRYAAGARHPDGRLAGKVNVPIV